MTLLDPEDRDLFTDLLRPPPGLAFDAGVGATYSLDLDTLLTVPLHLFLYDRGDLEDGLPASSVAVLDALRRIAARLRVYGQRGRIREPGGDRRLYTLLEQVAVEVEPPAGDGSFHPKLWLLRFRAPDERTERLRLLVLSRNLTRAPSWDLVLALDGRPGDAPRSENAPLARFLRRLPALATAGPDDEEEGPDLEALADEVARARWEVPGGFEEVRFHVTGIDGSGWLPAPSDRLMVVSPFVTDGALDALAGTTSDPAHLVSRPEELVELEPASPGRFGRVHVLDDMAEGVERDEEAPDLRGLHAKLYLAEDGGGTRLHLGSANATSAALLAGRNVEVMAELVGDTERVGGIDEVLDAGGLMDVLRAWTPPETPPEVDEDRRRAERQLDDARAALRQAGLLVRCDRAPDGDGWRLRLRAEEPPGLDDLAALRAWPVTVPRGRAVDARPLADGEEVELPARALASLTGLVAFRLEAEAADEAAAFVLNLPVEGLPRRERDAAVVRGIVRDRESFLRYLLLLLGEIDEGEVLGPGEGIAAAFEGR
jgi:hypothetical protein